MITKEEILKAGYVSYSNDEYDAFKLEKPSKDGGYSIVARIYLDKKSKSPTYFAFNLQTSKFNDIGFDLDLSKKTTMKMLNEVIDRFVGLNFSFDSNFEP